MLLDIYNCFRTEMNSGTFLGYFLQAVPVTVVVGIVYTIFRLVFLRRRKCHIIWFSEAMRSLLVCYLTGLCSLVILPANFWLGVYDGIFFGWWEYIGPFFQFGEVNLIPTIVKCLSGEFALSSWVNEMLVGNVVMFMPFGFFLPFVTERLNKKRALAIAVIVPVVVEFLQFIIGRSFDIDDLICNFFGIAVGFLISNGAKKVWGAVSRSQ